MARVRKKVVVIGNRDSGKTCLLNVFTKGPFLDDHFLDYFENCVADIQVDTKEVELVLWDIRGQEDLALSPMRTNMTYMDADVFLLCFSVANPDSLKSIIEEWAPEVRRFYPNVPSVLAGINTNQRNDVYVRDAMTKRNQVPVTVEEAQCVAKRIGAYAYVECSSVTGDGVQKVFQVAAQAALQETGRQKPSLFQRFVERFFFMRRTKERRA